MPRYQTNITVFDGIATFADGTQIKATVELLKAAPDLLSLLNALVVLADGYIGTAEWHEGLNKACVVIRKARGEA